jgi:hypothetical protein
MVHSYRVRQRSRPLTGLLEKQRREVAEWLSDVQSTTPPFTATPGTGQWLIRSDTFTEWENGEFQVLFCPGDGALSITAGVFTIWTNQSSAAGAGKTTLMYVSSFIKTRVLAQGTAGQSPSATLTTSTSTTQSG